MQDISEKRLCPSRSRTIHLDVSAHPDSNAVLAAQQVLKKINVCRMDKQMNDQMDGWMDGEMSCSLWSHLGSMNSQWTDWGPYNNKGDPQTGDKQHWLPMGRGTGWCEKEIRSLPFLLLVSCLSYFVPLCILYLYQKLI